MNLTTTELIGLNDSGLDENILDYKDETEETFNPMLWGTIGYLFLFIFRPYETLIPQLGAIHFERIYMLCLLAGLFNWSEKRYIPHKLNYALLAFFGVLCFSYFIAYMPDKAEDSIWEYFKLLVLYFVILLSIRNEKEFRILLLSFIVIMALYIGKSEWEFFVNGKHTYRMGIRRLIGIDETNGSPNSFAATIVYSLPFAWVLWKTSSATWVKVSLGCYGIMSLSGVALTGSRGGMLSVIFFFSLVWMRSKRKVVGLMLIVVVTSMSWIFMGGILQDRFRTLYDDKINATATASAEGRIEGVKRGIELFSLRPVWGWGTGNFAFATYEIGVTDGLQSHNMYAQLLAELGILGTIPFLALVLLLFLTKREVLSLSPAATDDDTGDDEGDMNQSFLALTAVACTDTVLLLLFQGNFGHNLYRYNWILVSAFLVLANHFSWGEEESENTSHN